VVVEEAAHEEVECRAVVAVGIEVADGRAVQVPVEAPPHGVALRHAHDQLEVRIDAPCRAIPDAQPEAALEQLRDAVDARGEPHGQELDPRPGRPVEPQPRELAVDRGVRHRAGGRPRLGRRVHQRVLGVVQRPPQRVRRFLVEARELDPAPVLELHRRPGRPDRDEPVREPVEARREPDRQPFLEHMGHRHMRSDFTVQPCR
jgi:hypothetical protein